MIKIIQDNGQIINNEETHFEIYILLSQISIVTIF